MVRLRRASVILVAAPVALLMSLVPAEAHHPITTDEIADQTIRSVDIGPDAVGKSELQSNSVGSAEILANAIARSELATGAVGNAELGMNSVTANKIQTGAVGASEIATGAVGADEIASGAVGPSEIATGAVTAGAIGTGQVAEDELKDDVQIVSIRTYSGTDSFQLIAPDLTLSSTAGSSDSTDPSFLAAGMGNVMGNNLAGTSNYVGGLIGHYSVTGTNASTYPVGAVLGGIGDGSTSADGAFVAYIDGDSAVTTADAAYKVMRNNSVPGSGFDFGVDLQDEARDGFGAIDETFYKEAPLRLVRDVVVLVDDGAPTAATGAGTAGKGSLYVDVTNGVLYINVGDDTTPSWVTVGSQ